MEKINLNKKELTISQKVEELKKVANKHDIYLKTWEIENDLKGKLKNNFSNMFFNLELYNNYELRNVKENENLYLFADKILKSLGLNLNSKNFENEYLKVLENLYYKKHSYFLNSNYYYNKIAGIKSYSGIYTINKEFKKIGFSKVDKQLNEMINKEVVLSNNLKGEYLTLLNLMLNNIYNPLDFKHLSYEELIKEFENILNKNNSKNIIKISYTTNLIKIKCKGDLLGFFKYHFLKDFLEVINYK